MNPDRYYQEELHYLKELGAEFAGRNASLAPFLARESFDPDVERLLEGFAFLTGRLRQKLDDELPELTQSLAQIVAPHLLTPIPAMTVVQFLPSATGGRARLTVARGAEVASRPIRGGRCRFRTCYDVTLTPARVVDASAVALGRRGRLRFELALTHRAEFAELRLDRLRLYLDPGGNGSLARALYLSLRTQCRGVRVEDASGRGFDLPSDIVRPVGFAAQEVVIPWPDKVAPGYRLLQEFFAFPDKFMFVDIDGLEGTAGFSGRRLSLTFDLDEPFAEASGLAADSVRLNATPVVNLFETWADPIRIDHRRGEYRLTARDSSGNGHAIHSVRHVRGHDPSSIGARGRAEYAPLETFDVLGQVRDRACYALRRKRNPATNAIDTLIAFSRSHGKSGTDEAGNGVVRGALHERNADRGDSGRPHRPGDRRLAELRHLPRHPANPPGVAAAARRVTDAPRDREHRRELQLDAQRRGTLRATLATCNRRVHLDYMERQRHARLAEGLESIGAAPLDWFVEGLPVRGWDLEVTVSESKLGGLGDACLFSAVLGAFFDDLASINTVHRLTLTARETNRRFRSPVRIGRKAVL